MDNMVTNVYAKSNYDRLRIDKALGFRKSDNNKNKKKQVSSVMGLVSLRAVGSFNPLTAFVAM